MSGPALLVPTMPAWDGVGTLILEAPLLPAFVPVPPPPGPGDPETPWTPPAPAKRGRRLASLICAAGTHEKLAEVETMDVESWDDPLTIREPSTIVQSASTWDPAWQDIGAQWTTHRDLAVYDPKDMRQFEAMLVDVDTGGTLAAGYFDDVIDLGSGRESLSTRGPAALWDVTMGGTPVDLLNGRGRFEGSWLGSAAGYLAANDFETVGLEVRWSTSESVEGGRHLQVRRTGSGDGVLRAPVVPIQASSDYRRQMTTSAMIRVRGEGDVYCTTDVFTSGATQVNGPLTQRDADVLNEPEWRPAESVGTCTLADVAQFYRAVFRLRDTTSWIDFDLIRYPLDSGTGSHFPQDVAAYPGLILRRLQDLADPDGRQTGHSAYPWQGTSKGITLWWPDVDDVTAIDAVGEAMDHRDGVEVWYDAGWRMNSAPRRGQNRTDIRLDDDVVLMPSWSTDPRLYVDRLSVLLPFGTGAGRVVERFGTLRPVTQRIRSERTQAPSHLDWAGAMTWGANRQAQGARDQRYADLLVPYSVGLELETGDGVEAFLVDGRRYFNEMVRIANRTFYPKRELCRLSVGLDPVTTGGLDG